MTDWQEGKPPYGIKAHVWSPRNDSVRFGYSDGAYFRYLDCMHPLQNSLGFLDDIAQWRAVENIE